jgi:amino-acid N-acetyltransferase
MSSVTLRCATPGDQDAICALVKRERLNPTGLHWPNFIVAADERGVVGGVNLWVYRDGARELGSLVVAPDLRRQGLAARLIDTLLATQRVPVQMITGAAHAGHYRRWGFEPIEPRRAPRSVRLNYRIGRLARLISFMRGQPARRLMILERPAPGT